MYKTVCYDIWIYYRIAYRQHNWPVCIRHNYTKAWIRPVPPPRAITNEPDQEPDPILEVLEEVHVLEEGWYVVPDGAPILQVYNS